MNDAKIADIDGDGDLDVVAAYKFYNHILYYENTNGSANLWDQKVLSNKNTIDLYSLASSLYLCKVKDLENNFGIQKVIKK